MTHLDCPCFHRPDMPTITLQNIQTDEHVTVCARALSSAARLKADVHDAGGRSTLAEHGHEYGWGLWRSQHILYLIPPVPPFQHAHVDDEIAPVALVGAVDS